MAVNIGENSGVTIENKRSHCTDEEQDNPSIKKRCEGAILNQNTNPKEQNDMDFIMSQIENRHPEGLAIFATLQFILKHKIKSIYYTKRN